MMRKLLAVIAATASGLLLSGAVNAADTTAPGAKAAAPPADPGGSAVVSYVNAKGPAIAVAAGKGILIRLPHPAATVFIARPDIADVQVKSPTLIYLTAKIPGETVLYAVDAQDHVLLNAPVEVGQDVGRVQQSVSALAPGENVKVSSVDNSLVLSGRVSSAGRAATVSQFAHSIAKETKGNVIDRLSVATPNQVNIRVKVAEVDRKVLKQLGLNWSKVGQHLSFSANNAAATANSVSVALGGASSQILGMLDVLGTEGFLTTLAEPNLTATNGQPASFLAGGEFPVPTISPGTAGGTVISSVEFKKFGVQLDVTPTIIDAEHLNMVIRTEVSQLSQNGAVILSGFSIPALTDRIAQTTVELGSGQSFLLGGLLQNDSTESISKVPGLGDIPVIGQLFRSQSFQRDESELVIVVTPYLVKPALANNLALPTDGFEAPHDMQQFINGATYRQGLPAPARGPLGAGAQGLVGPVGFSLD